MEKKARVRCGALPVSNPTCAVADGILVLTPMNWPVELIGKIDARHRLVLAFILAGTACFLLHGHVRLWSQIIATWNVFAFSVLILAWLTIVTTPQAKLRMRAKTQDVGHGLIFIFVVVATVACLAAVVFVLHSNRGANPSHVSIHLALSFLAVLFSWTLLHTVFALHYAHTFYGDADDPTADRHAGGLQFPEEKLPDYLDFAYFSFVIGMTFQVSDVQISSRELRHLALLHSLLSFGFNTVILALAINAALNLL